MAKYKILSLDRLRDPSLPIREDITPEGVSDLVESIREVGILEPLLVRQDGNMFEVVAGHRRFFAAQLLHLTEAPVLIIDVNETEAETLKLHENTAREDVSPLAWAKYLLRLKQQLNLDTDKISQLLRKSTAWISQHLAILDYPANLRAALDRGEIAFTSARELASIKDPKTREVYIDHAIRGGVTPALAARWRKQANSKPPRQTTSEPISPPQPPSEPELTPLRVCPVCSETIDPLDELAIVIHDKCQPHD